MAMWPSWFSDRNDLTTFDLHVTLMLPTKFQVDLPFDSGEAKIRFLSWLPRQPSWISDRTILAIFDRVTCCFLPSFKSNGHLVQEKKQKIDFQDGHGGHLGFPIGTILAIFDVQVTLMLLTEFHVNWPFGSGEEANKSTTSIIPRNSNHFMF